MNAKRIPCSLTGDNLSLPDDTYMYDEDARCGGAGGGSGPVPGGPAGPGGHHWYDEPPYESDPEDFLMGATGGPVPTATIQNGRLESRFFFFLSL